MSQMNVILCSQIIPRREGKSQETGKIPADAFSFLDEIPLTILVSLHILRT